MTNRIVKHLTNMLNEAKSPDEMSDNEIIDMEMKDRFEKHKGDTDMMYFHEFKNGFVPMKLSPKKLLHIGTYKGKEYYSEFGSTVTQARLEFADITGKDKSAAPAEKKTGGNKSTKLIWVQTKGGIWSESEAETDERIYIAGNGISIIDKKTGNEIFSRPDYNEYYGKQKLQQMEDEYQTEKNLSSGDPETTDAKNKLKSAFDIKGRTLWYVNGYFRLTAQDANASHGHSGKYGMAAPVQGPITILGTKRTPVIGDTVYYGHDFPIVHDTSALSAYSSHKTISKYCFLDKELYDLIKENMSLYHKLLPGQGEGLSKTTIKVATPVKPYEPSLWE